MSRKTKSHKRSGYQKHIKRVALSHRPMSREQLLASIERFSDEDKLLLFLVEKALEGKDVDGVKFLRDTSPVKYREGFDQLIISLGGKP